MKTTRQRGALFASLLLCASNAHAQTGAEVATRNALLEDATAARRSGDHNAALEYALRAGRIGMTPSVRLFIAQEQAQTGRIADALGNAQQCSREAERTPTLPSREQLLETCRALATELAGRVGRVLIRTPIPAPEGLRVTIDGEPLSDTFFGVPYVITPGALVIEATAVRRVTFNEQLRVEAGQLREVHLVLPEIEQNREENSTLLREDPPEPPSLVGPVVVLATGAVALGLAGPFYALRSAQLDLLSGCPASNRCPDTTGNREALDNARTYNAVTNAMLIGGGVVALGGAVWMTVTLVRRANLARASSRALHVVPSPFGLGAHFTF